MIFIPIDDIHEGMTLAKDVKIYNHELNDVDLLKEGLKLTKLNINRLKRFGSVGLYINDGNDDIKKPDQIIDSALRTEAICELEKLFASVDKNPKRVDDTSLLSVNNISTKIVNNILHNKKYMVNIIDLKMYDDYTYNHSLSVAVLATAIGISLDLDDKSLYELSLCALLHDIGKTEIPHHLIDKPSKLSNDEFDIIKSHPKRGGKYVIKNNLVTENIYNGIISHHEKFDGTGYPFGIKGKEIPLYGRIIAVADVYDALTSNRPYRMPATPSEAIEYIMGGNEVMFDPDIVKAFLSKIAPYPVNDCVKLSNGQIGIVTKVYSENPLRPEVKIIGDGNIYYNLFKDQNLYNIVVSHSL